MLNKCIKCVVCRYDLTGLTQKQRVTCPECGCRFTVLHISRMTSGFAWFKRFLILVAFSVAVNTYIDVRFLVRVTQEDMLIARMMAQISGDVVDKLSEHEAMLVSFQSHWRTHLSVLLHIIVLIGILQLIACLQSTRGRRALVRMLESLNNRAIASGASH